jgi:hypothetical protein
MKKPKSRNRKSAAKNKGAPKNVEEYIARVPQPARSTLQKMRAAIRSAVPPDAVEIISYGIPAFKHKRVSSGTPRFQITAVCSPPPQSSKNSRTN